jgi:uncharacterized protein (UPF0332 family)
MKMSLEDLLKERLLSSIRIDNGLVAKTFQIAERDLGVAKKVFEEESYSWSFAIAYNSMLQAGRSLMFSRGFKPSGEHKHVSVLRFLHEVFDNELTDRMITIFDRMRKKRHAMVYDEPDVISEQEAKNAIIWAEEFIQKVETILNKEGFE